MGRRYFTVYTYKQPSYMQCQCQPDALSNAAEIGKVFSLGAMFFGGKTALRVTAAAVLLELANTLIPQCNHCCARKVLDERWHWACPRGCDKYAFAMPMQVVDIAELYSIKYADPWST